MWLTNTLVEFTASHPRLITLLLKYRVRKHGEVVITR